MFNEQVGHPYFGLARAFLFDQVVTVLIVIFCMWRHEGLPGDDKAGREQFLANPLEGSALIDVMRDGLSGFFNTTAGLTCRTWDEAYFAHEGRPLFIVVFGPSRVYQSGVAGGEPFHGLGSREPQRWIEIENSQD